VYPSSSLVYKHFVDIRTLTLKTGLSHILVLSPITKAEVKSKVYAYGQGWI